jgi:hypothetical protein
MLCCDGNGSAYGARNSRAGQVEEVQFPRDGTNSIIIWRSLLTYALQAHAVSFLFSHFRSLDFLVLLGDKTQDLLLRALWVTRLDFPHVLLNKVLIFGGLAGPGTRGRFCLHQFTLTVPALVLHCVNAFGMPLELDPAVCAFPYILVLDSIRVLRCDFYSPVTKVS